MNDIDYESLLTKDVLQAFKWSMKKNYTPIPDSWESITRNFAWEEYLKPYLSRQAFYNYVNDGYFRQDTNGNVYTGELERYRDLCEFVYNAGLKQEKKDGKNRYVFYYVKADKAKLSSHNELMRSGFALLRTKWFKDMQETVDLSE